MQFQLRILTEKTGTEGSNVRTSGNGAVALWFAIQRLRRAVPERGR
jgi:hypothetical protein